MRACVAALLVALSLSWPASAVQAQLPEWIGEILAASRLPVVADSARREGTFNEDVRAVLEAMSKSRVPAHEATVILDSARAARREHGPVDNFGAFVQSQLAEGKRGRELAAAIRAEHARQGKGNAGRAGRGGDDDNDDDDDRAARGRGQARDSADRARGRNNPGSSARPDSTLDSKGNRGQGKGRPDNSNR